MKAEAVLGPKSDLSLIEAVACKGGRGYFDINFSARGNSDRH